MAQFFALKAEQVHELLCIYVEPAPRWHAAPLHLDYLQIDQGLEGALNAFVADGTKGFEVLGVDVEPTIVAILRAHQPRAIVRMQKHREAKGLDRIQAAQELERHPQLALAVNVFRGLA